jgi:molybdenum cofactor guanylyltransferase
VVVAIFQGDWNKGNVFRRQIVLAMLTSIVLVGGKGSRIGGEKVFQLVGGETLLNRVVDSLSLLGNSILVVGSLSNVSWKLNADVRYIDDLYPNLGPLGGIYTGLVAANSPYSIVVACDFPFLNVGFLRHMVEISPGFDVVVPRVDRAQPLQAVYSKSCLSSMKMRLKRGWLGVTRFLSTVNVRYVDREECCIYDPEFLSLFNVNCPEDLARANIIQAETQVR